MLTLSYRGQSYSVTDPLEIQLLGFLHAQAQVWPLAHLQKRGEVTITWGRETMQAAVRCWGPEARRQR